jgi:hypothetical protein
VEEFYLGPPHVVEIAGLGGRQEASRVVEEARLNTRLGSNHSSPNPFRRFGCQGQCALSECSSGGEAAACLRAAGQAVEFEGDVLVGAGGRRGEMPSTAVGFGVPVGCLG